MSQTGQRPPMRSASAVRPGPLDTAPSCAKLPWRADMAPDQCQAPAHRTGPARARWLVVLEEEDPRGYGVQVLATANACDTCADRLSTTRGAELCRAS